MVNLNDNFICTRTCVSLFVLKMGQMPSQVKKNRNYRSFTISHNDKPRKVYFVFSSM